MKFAVSLSVLILLCSVNAFAQEISREQKLEKIKEHSRQIKQLTDEFLLPDAKDFVEAKKNNFEVFRIMPREAYDDEYLMMIRVAYFSFTEKANGYGKNPEIELQKNNLGVGFAGANYGFIADLGETPLAGINRETAEVNFLANYKPPIGEPEVRAEQRRAINYEADGFTFKNKVPAIVGHSYALRAITFRQADVLVVFKIHRKDTDGSLIIFWKLIEQFAKPEIYRSDEIAQRSAGIELERKILNALKAKGFNDVSVDVSTVPVTLRGIVPKGKLVEAVQTAMEAGGGKPVMNQISER